MRKRILYTIIIGAAVALIQNYSILLAQNPEIKEPIYITITKTVPDCEALVLTYSGKTSTNFTYRWFKDDIEIPGSNNFVFRKEKITIEDAGTYYVKISNPCSEVRSNNVNVVIAQCPNTVITKDPEPLPANLQPMTLKGEDLSTGFELFESEPNPASDDAKIRFTSPYRANIQIILTDISGNKLISIVDNELPAGEHEVYFKASQSSLPSGVYYLVMTAPEFRASKKMIIIK
ncbi:MAG: 5'-Nucleotidase domain protein [Ignavibacteria bacterium]|nr:5'-Nucleotidase domain protein [Ignavibacteria bacterium]